MGRNGICKTKFLGISSIELVMSILVVVILVMLGGPSFKNLFTEQRLKLAGEILFSDLRYAQAEAIKRRAQIVFQLNSGSSWCYGFSDTSSCNCSIANSCLLNGVEKVVRASNYTNIILSSSTITSNTLTFSAIKGAVNNAGAVTFTQDSKSIQVSINNLGFVSICSNDIVGYGAC